MKKVLAAVAVAGVLASAGAALAGVAAGTGVNGSLHDMTRVVPGTADDMGRVCVYCHTPHHATSNSTSQLPLWNHTLTDVSQFTAYTWATPNNAEGLGEVTISDPLQGPSRLCMSCHDGAIAIDEHGSAFAQAGGTTIQNINNLDYAGRANLGKDLSQTHPIGFDYIQVAAFRNAKSLNGTGAKVGTEFAQGTEIVDATNGYATAISINDTAQGQYNDVTRASGGKRIADNLYGGNIMTCATCHEVHNKENATQENFKSGKTLTVLGSAQKAPNYFLYAKEANSLICLSCHVK